MASRYLCGVSFLELLPENLADDPNIKAAARVIDSEFDKLCDLAPALSIWENLKNTTEPLLGNLAWQMHVDSIEGYGLAETNEEKQRLIASSIEAHRYKGTRWALERIAEILGMRMELVAWYETEPKGRPYTFRIQFLEVIRPIGPELYEQLDQLVLALKNKRSYLEGVNIFLTTKGAFYLGAVMLTGSSVTVYPWQNKGITLQNAAPYIGAAVQYANTLTVYPEA